MYSDLKNVLETQKLCDLVPLCNLNTSCCSSNTIVWNVNHIKSVFYSIIGKNHPKSVNGLFFNANNKLKFICIENYYALYSKLEISQLEQELLKGTLFEKINGTILLLTDIINHFLVIPFDTFYNTTKREKINTLVLVNLSDRDYVKLRLGHLDLLNIKNDNEPYAGKIILVDEKDLPKHLN